MSDTTIQRPLVRKFILAAAFLLSAGGVLRYTYDTSAGVASDDGSGLSDAARSDGLRSMIAALDGPLVSGRARDTQRGGGAQPGVAQIGGRELAVQISTPDGRAAAGIPVTITPSERGGLSKRRLTSATGAVSFSGLGPGGYSIEAAGPLMHGALSDQRDRAAQFLDLRIGGGRTVRPIDSTLESLMAISADVPASALDRGDVLPLTLCLLPVIRGRLINDAWPHSSTATVWIYPKGGRDRAIASIFEGEPATSSAFTVDPMTHRFGPGQLPPGSYGAIATMGLGSLSSGVEGGARVQISKAIDFDVLPLDAGTGEAGTRRAEDIELHLEFEPQFQRHGALSCPRKSL